MSTLDRIGCINLSASRHVSLSPIAPCCYWRDSDWLRTTQRRRFDGGSVVVNVSYHAADWLTARRCSVELIYRSTVILVTRRWRT